MKTTSEGNPFDFEKLWAGQRKRATKEVAAHDKNSHPESYVDRAMAQDGMDGNQRSQEGIVDSLRLSVLGAELVVGQINDQFSSEPPITSKVTKALKEIIQAPLVSDYGLERFLHAIKSNGVTVAERALLALVTSRLSLSFDACVSLREFLNRNC